jgi:hypothetical protein
MRTSNFFSIAALVICGMVCVNSVKAQESSNVTVNLKFKPVQSIEVNLAQETVDLVYETPDDYHDGVSKKMEDHLTVFSTDGGFVVSVNAEDVNFVRTGGGGGTIPVSHVILSAEEGSTTNPEYTPTLSTITLSTTPTALITSTAGGNGLKYSVTYDNTTEGSDYKYINKYIHSDGLESVYTAEVTYTIAAD